MDNNEVQLVGGPCGQHGPYTFYKAFKYTKNGVKRIVTLSEFFFVKLWMDSDLVCIGELQLLWADKNSEQVLASLRLYFLPENTPEGRMDHGEDEVLAISEKVVLKVDDLITWITNDAEWSWGRLAKCVDRLKEPQEPQDQQATSVRLTESALDFSDVEKERKLIENKLPGPSVIILSYPRYCRYRSVMKRLEGVEDDYIRHKIVNALGGINVRSDNTRILFCKDTFDYPELEGHELLCNHLAPKLKGRPRGKRKKRSVSPGSESNESESSVSNIFTTGKITTEGGRNGLRCDSTTSPRRSTRATENSESKDFIKKLSMFMKSNRTPMGRIPSLGYKELDLHSFYIKVQKLGGYDSVTANRLWKSIFDDLSGNQASTSAATVIRRHYERFLLAYERHSKGEEYKPLPVSERRRLKSKAGSSSASDAETSESTSRSGNSTPIPHHIPSCSTPCTPTDNKEFYMKMENKPSSLRSVRVKPERLRDATKDKVENCEEEVKHLPEKHPEPTTGAVAPVQKIVPEKSTSPAEGKENIPIFNARDTQTIDDDDDLIEVPYKPESPEIIDLESEVYNTSSMTNNNNNSSSNNNNTQSAVMEVKKGKLDILKEGGLEVTPVRHFAVPQSKEPRASVVHPSLEKRQMPPPSINATLIKRPHLPPAQISPKPPKYPQTFTYTPSSPPKIIQSKSIYNPSQKTVYGDPKDLFGHQIHQVQAPKFVPKPPVTDLLDLTVRSPQKPVVEIMRVPPIPSPKIPKNMYNMPALPSLEGRRISSNLEITLVGPSKAPPIPSPPKKRHYPEMFPPNKIPRMEENGRKMHHYQVHPHTSKKHHNIPNPYIRPPTKHDKSLPQLPQLNKYSNHPMPPMYPNYLTPTSTATNKVPYPPIDPMYLQALQNLYPSPMHPVPSPMFPMLSRERLLMYSQLSYSYGMPQENHPSITSSDNNKVKKQ